MSTELSVQEKYRLYEAAVQCPAFDIDFMLEEYKKSFGKTPYIFREDFGGTGLISCEWVKRNPKNKAYAIDLDDVPIAYGVEKHFAQLTLSQKKRMFYVQENVLNATSYSADVVAALNFSYFIFKARKDLLKYFKSVRKSLSSTGAFFLDAFGGTECSSPCEDQIEHKNFTYYWDCHQFNPLNSECLYKIHFRPKGHKRKIKDVFVYDWRMWSLREIKETLLEAGFSKVQIYWEEEDEKGEGTDKYIVQEIVENCPSWVSFIMALA